MSDQSLTVYSLAEYNSSDDNVNREDTSQSDKHQSQPVQQTSAQLTDKQEDTEQPSTLVTQESDDTPFSLPDIPLLNDPTRSATFKKALKSDATLKSIRGLAHNSKSGYVWSEGLIFHDILDPTLGTKRRLVVPQPFRQQLLTIAHDKSGHFSTTKTRSILNHRFTWPNMSQDIANHILACETCKKFNKSSHKPAPL